MNEESIDFLAIFKATHALLEGHFRLSSGRHSDKYMQCARVLQHPSYARQIGIALGELFSSTPADAVIAPAVGGILVAHELAAALKIRAIFGERENGVMSLRRGFEIQPGEKLIVVEDVITTGKSTGEIVDLVVQNEGIVTGIGAIVDRSQGSLEFKPRTLLRLDIQNWDPNDCPLCRENIPLHTPGSRFKK